MNKKFTDFYKAFNWLQNHPALRYKPLDETIPCETSFPANLDIMVVKVNPKTNKIAKNEKLNTATRIWLEPMIYKKYDEAEPIDKNDDRYYFGVAYHDADCDCGGATFEEAIIKYANLVRKEYGDYDPKKAEDEVFQSNCRDIRKNKQK